MIAKRQAEIRAAERAVGEAGALGLASRAADARRRHRPGHHEHAAAGGRGRRRPRSATPSATASTTRGPAGSSTTRWSCWPMSAPVPRLPGRRRRSGLDNQGESCLAWDGADRRAAVAGDRLAGQPHRRGHRAAACRRCRGPDASSGPACRSTPTSRPPSSPGCWARSGRRPSLRLGTTDAWFLDRLTGRFVTDVTTASRTSLMNLATCAGTRSCAGCSACRSSACPRSARPSATFGGDRRRAADGRRRRPAGRTLRPWLPRVPATPRSPSAPAPSRWRSPAPRSCGRPSAACCRPWPGDIGAETVHAVDGGVYDAGRGGRVGGPPGPVRGPRPSSTPSPSRRRSSAGSPSSRPCPASPARTGTAAPGPCGSA